MKSFMKSKKISIVTLSLCAAACAGLAFVPQVFTAKADVDFSNTVEGFTQKDGAGIRYGTEASVGSTSGATDGIRFQASITNAALDELTDGDPTKITDFGMLIVKGDAITSENVDTALANGTKHSATGFDVNYTYTETTDDDNEEHTFRVAVYGIQDKMKKYAARAYITVDDVDYYANVTKGYNIRSAFQVAEAMKAGGYSNEGGTEASAEQKSYIDGVINSVTQGVEYAWDDTAKCYYVSSGKATAGEVEILSAYDTIVNGKAAVTYVKGNAFENNSSITKVTLPETVTEIDGNVFQGCGNLEYVSMTGVTSLTVVGGIERPCYESAEIRENVFRNCTSLSTLIVNKALTAGNHFTYSSGTPVGFTVYVNGSEEESAVTISMTGTSVMSVKNTYYLGDLSGCKQWKFNAEGEIETSAADHSYTDGRCTLCSQAQTAGINYGYYDGSYFVLSYTGSAKEVYVQSTYDDGTNGEASVTRIARKAFYNNDTITKVVLPSTVQLLDGMVFQDCGNLEYVSMTGVETMRFVNIANKEIYAEGNEWGLVGEATSNNFHLCTKLTTLIVGTKFSHGNNAQFNGGSACVNVYVDGSEGESNVNASSTSNVLLTGQVYYKGNLNRCQQWKLNAEGEIETSAAAHTFVDGVCTVCTAVDTKGVKYCYDSVVQGYYVAGYTGTDAVVEVLGTYDDGANGSDTVDFVAYRAFYNNTTITKVILPSSVTQLDGMVFQGCTNLEYLSMTGVKTMQFTGLTSAHRSYITSDTKITDNNFHLCSKLTKMVVGTEFSLGGNQQAPIGSNTATIDLYVDGADDSTFNANFGTANGLFTQNVYYRSDSEQAGSWYYGEDGVATLWS